MEGRYDVDVEPDTPLLWVLRDTIGLTGTKYGCGIAQCGACTVHIDGVATRSCQVPVGTLGAASEVTTIEALAQNGKLHPVQTGLGRPRRATMRLLSEWHDDGRGGAA
jgi:isoquinoline 1-oxidoreductase alpha subunit